MEIIVPKYRRDPNQMVSSIYAGVAPGNKTITTVVRPSGDRNHMERVSTYGDGLPRGVGGRIGVLVIGGMVTTLDEMEYIIEAKREKVFVPKHTKGEIMAMCRLAAERRNEQIREARRLAQRSPSTKRRVQLHLPVGFRFTKTAEPGLEVATRR